MATVGDMQVVAAVVSDAAELLDWCAGTQAFLQDPNGQITPVVPEDLLDAYAAAIDQLLEVHVRLAMLTLSGDNPSFPPDAVSRVLDDAGWTGALRDFKLRVLERTGRAEVMEVARGGRRRGGRIGRRVFGAFLGGLNAALDSLEGIPGAGGIREVKDFLERVIGG